MTLKSLEDFVEEGGRYEMRFDSVRNLDKDTPERLDCMAEIERWLHECVAHGRYMPDRSPDRRALQGLVDFWTTVLRQSGQNVADIRRLAPFNRSAGVPLDKDCPYPGLNALGRDKEKEFFGREKTIQDCLEHFKSHRILLILGGSGSGKSSLAMAGVLPALEKEPTHSIWKFMPALTPGAKPFVSLGHALATASGDESRAGEISDRLSKEPQHAPGILNELFGGAPMMLFIDQFEELLTLCQDAQQQKTFANLLCALAAESDEPAKEHTSSAFLCHTLMTLRTDHLARFENNESLRTLYQLLTEKDNIKQLGGVDFESIRRAIEVPAKNVGLRFLPPTIIDGLASQTASLANGLPLLQFALRRLWDERPKDEQGQPLDFINEESVKALPDVQNALGKVAEEVFRSLDGEKSAGGKQPTEDQYGKKQNLCKRLMLELVVLDENFEEPLRRRRSIAELHSILDERWSKDTVDEVIKAFQVKGLLRPSGSGDAQQIEVAHEAMFRNWPTFREWIEGDDVKKRLHALKLITREAADWRGHSDSLDYLKQTGEPLKSALRYLEEKWLVDSIAEEYLKACKRHEEKKAEQQEQLNLEKARARQAEMKLMKSRYTLVLLALLVIGGVVGYWFYWAEQKTATLNMLPLVAATLPSSEALNVAQSVANKGGNDFRYVLAYSLERMDGTPFTPSKLESPNSIVFFAGQGTAVFQLDQSDPKNQKLKVFRVCDPGEVDKVSAEIPLGEREIVKAEIGPPISSLAGDRVMVMAFKKAGHGAGFDLEASSLSWKGSSPCTSEGPSKQLPDVPTEVAIIATKQIEDADNILSIAFDSDERSAVFSALRFSDEPDQPPKSTLWQLLFQKESKDWKIEELKIKPVGNLSSSDKDGESTVNAVAFSGSNDSEPVERLITGHLDGDIYCGSKLLHSKVAGARQDRSPVREIWSRPDSSKNRDWFAYQQKSGRVSAGRCKEELFPFPYTDTENISSVNLNYVKYKNGHEMPLVTYVEARQLKCWTWGSDEKSWQERKCNLPALVDQVAISPDANATDQVAISSDANARHLVTIEVKGLAAVHRYPLPFRMDMEKDVGSRLAGNTVILWNTEDDDRSKSTDWQKTKLENDFERFEASSPNKTAVRGAALSPSGKQIVWVELVTQPNNEYKVSLFETSTQRTRNVDRKKTPPGALTVAVDDNGLTAIASGNELQLYNDKQDEASHPDPFHPIELPDIGKEELISCLGFSLDSNNLVVGSEAGNLWRLKKDKPEEPWKPENHPRTKKNPASSVTACAVSNDGTIVGGFTDGSVWVFKPGTSFKPIQLSPQAVYQFSMPVKAVSLEEGQDKQPHHVAALSEWQASGCTRPGLPGQSVQIWDLRRVWDLQPGDQPPPVSTRCFPNQRVTTIGSVRPIESEGKITNVQLPVVFGKEVQLLSCRGCARGNETPEEMLQRLMTDAKQLGAQVIKDEELTKTYGIKF